MDGTFQEEKFASPPFMYIDYLSFGELLCNIQILSTREVTFKVYFHSLISRCREHVLVHTTHYTERPSVTVKLVGLGIPGCMLKLALC